MEQELKEASRKSKRRKGDAEVEVPTTEVQYLSEGEHRTFRFRLPIQAKWGGYHIRFVHEKELPVFERLLNHYSLTRDTWTPICASLETVLNAELWPRMKVLAMRLVVLGLCLALPVVGYVASNSLIGMSICLGISVLASVAAHLLLNWKLRLKQKNCRKALDLAIHNLNGKISALEQRGSIVLSAYPESSSCVEGLTISMGEIYTRRDLQSEAHSEAIASASSESTARTTIQPRDGPQLCEDCLRLHKFTRDEGLASLTVDLCVCARKDRDEFQRMILGASSSKPEEDMDNEATPNTVEDSSAVCEACASSISPTYERT